MRTRPAHGQFLRPPLYKLVKVSKISRAKKGRGDEGLTAPSEKSAASDANSRGKSPTNVLTSVPSGKVTGSTKGSRVIVRFREKGTENYLADPEVLVGATGDAYDAIALKKDFPGYAFDSASPDFAPAQGAFANEPQTVVLEYVPVTYGSLVVRHIDHETGERLTDDVTSQHAVGEQYATQGGAFLTGTSSSSPQKTPAERSSRGRRRSPTSTQGRSSLRPSQSPSPSQTATRARAREGVLPRRPPRGAPEGAPCPTRASRAPSS